MWSFVAGRPMKKFDSNRCRWNEKDSSPHQLWMLTFYGKLGSGDSSAVEHQTCDQNVSGSSPGMSGCQISFLPQGQLSVLALISVSAPPLWYSIACKRSRSFCQKCRRQVALKRTRALRTWLGLKWHYKLVRDCMVYTWCAPIWQQLHVAPAM